MVAPNYPSGWPFCIWMEFAVATDSKVGAEQRVLEAVLPTIKQAIAENHADMHPLAPRGLAPDDQAKDKGGWFYAYVTIDYKGGENETGNWQAKYSWLREAAESAVTGDIAFHRWRIVASIRNEPG